MQGTAWPYPLLAFLGCSPSVAHVLQNEVVSAVFFVQLSAFVHLWCQGPIWDLLRTDS